MHLEHSMVMYGVYNAETLENLIYTVHCMHNSTMEIEKIFVGQLNTAYTWYINAPGTQHYAIDSLLYLRTTKDKYIQMYKEFITEQHKHAKANRISAKAIYLSHLLCQKKLEEILEAVKTTITKINPDYLEVGWFKIKSTE